MSRILVTGAGGTPAINFIRSLRRSDCEFSSFDIVGVDCDKYHLQRCPESTKFLVPKASDPEYVTVLNDIIDETGCEFIHSQNDKELAVISDHREELHATTFLPSKETVIICHSKIRSHYAWQWAGLKQPRTWFINSPVDLTVAFKEVGNGSLWLRRVSGAAGTGSILANTYEMARQWLSFQDGWGQYTAAEYLSTQSITWQSIWKDGTLIVAQSRRRINWEFSDRSPSGVTGLTGVGITCSDSQVDNIAQSAIYAVSKTPHGIFSVDLTFDSKGVPNPTEINIGRFFTTHEFFTQAGLNMPSIYVNLALGNPIQHIERRINPLVDGLLWIRGMDIVPILTTVKKVDESEWGLKCRLEKLHPEIEYS